MGVLDASQFQLVMCWKRFCGFSTQVRNGTCCRPSFRRSLIFLPFRFLRVICIERT